MKEKRKNILIGILIGIIVLLIGVCIYLVFFKKEDVKKDTQKLMCECNDITENVVENVKYKPIDFSIIESDINRDASYEISNPKLPKTLSISTYDENLNQKYITVTLSKEGIITIKQEGKDNIIVSDVNNVMDIEQCAGEVFGNFYILLNNGDVYEYKFVNNKVIKIDEIKDATKFVKIDFCYYQAGCDMLLGIIDKNDKYIELNSYST